MKTRRTGFVLAFLLSCLPATAQANAGTVVIFAVMLHLVIGNAFIGLLEGLTLGLGFGVRKFRAVWVMVLANYFSAWIGMILLRGTIALAIPENLYWTSASFWTWMFGAYLATLFLEWPFVAFCFRGDKRWLRKSIIASLVIQTISYGGLVVWYQEAHKNTLGKEATPVPVEEIALPDGFTVYYISNEDQDVYRRRLDGRQSERVCDAGEVGTNAFQGRGDRLQFVATGGDGGPWELQLVPHGDEEGRVLASLGASLIGEIPTALDRGDGDGPDGRVVHRLGSARESPWEFRLWAPGVTIGIGGTDTRNGREVCLEHQTLMAQWFAQSATHLPGDLLLFQFGHDQICVWDVPNRKVALWGRGHGPVVVRYGEGREEAGTPATSREIEEDAPVGEGHKTESRPE